MSTVIIGGGDGVGLVIFGLSRWPMEERQDEETDDQGWFT